MTTLRNKIKTFLFVLVAMALALVFAGCGEYKPPANEPGGGTENPPVVNPDPIVPDPDPIIPDDDSFTVTLVTTNGTVIDRNVLRTITQVQALWTNKETPEVRAVNFNGDGVAKCAELDGDYKVTLKNLPDKYSYEPNSYEATNDFKEVRITVYEVTPLGAVQTNAKDPYYNIRSTGAYRVELKSPSDKVLFNFMPSGQGLYTMESMVDVTDNRINPLLELYYGNLAAAGYYADGHPAMTADGGATENTYTKNFKLEYTLSPEESGGSNGMIFKLFSTALSTAKYPLVVDFILDRDGDFKNPSYSAKEVEVTEDFENVPYEIKNPDGEFTYFVKRDGIKNNRLNEKLVAKYEVKDGGDGYWHFVEEKEDPATGKKVKVWGERLYAKISQRTEVTNEPFTGGHMMPLLTYIYADGDTEPRGYTNFVTTYAANCNADGVYPVNDEIRLFLQRFAVSQRYFNDGNGWAETFDDENAYNSDEESMWLFACGYYAV